MDIVGVLLDSNTTRHHCKLQAREVIGSTVRQRGRNSITGVYFRTRVRVFQQKWVGTRFPYFSISCYFWKRNRWAVFSDPKRHRWVLMTTLRVGTQLTREVANDDVIQSHYRRAILFCWFKRKMKFDILRIRKMANETLLNTVIRWHKQSIYSLSFFLYLASAISNTWKSLCC